MLKAKKCCLCAKKITYLGHVVSAEGGSNEFSQDSSSFSWSTQIWVNRPGATHGCKTYTSVEHTARSYCTLHTLVTACGILLTMDSYKSLTATLKRIEGTLKRMKGDAGSTPSAEGGQPNVTSQKALHILTTLWKAIVLIRLYQTVPQTLAKQKPARSLSQPRMMLIFMAWLQGALWDFCCCKWLDRRK